MESPYLHGNSIFFLFSHNILMKVSVVSEGNGMKDEGEQKQQVHRHLLQVEAEIILG